MVIAALAQTVVQAVLGHVFCCLGVLIASRVISPALYHYSWLSKAGARAVHEPSDNIASIQKENKKQKTNKQQQQKTKQKNNNKKPNNNNK